MTHHLAGKGVLDDLLLDFWSSKVDDRREPDDRPRLEPCTQTDPTSPTLTFIRLSTTWL